jgi:hypothetical protein
MGKKDGESLHIFSRKDCECRLGESQPRIRMTKQIYWNTRSDKYISIEILVECICNINNYLRPFDVTKNKPFNKEHQTMFEKSYSNKTLRRHILGS